MKIGKNKLLQAAVVVALAASSSLAMAASPDLSGFWELRADSKKVSPAALTEHGKKLTAAFRPKVEDGVIMTHASRWCQPLGTPFIMGDSAPLDIIQSKREIAITAEVQSSARHIYIDGRGHPPMESFDPTTNGHSIGKWENGVLVVDTVGFNDRGNPGVPGGGLRGETSHLVERYELLDGGKKLQVTFTWDDPQVFLKPHTYTFTYYKAPDDAYALEYFCDASDPERAKTAEEPEQIGTKQ